MGASAFLNNVRYAFRPSKPILTARLAGAVVRSKLFRKSFLRYVDFSLDFACNLRCEHCFATALKSPGRRVMGTEDYSRVADEAMRLGALNFSFQGGEPLMFPGLKDVISACAPERNLISVTTNGTLLDEEKAAELKSWGVDILTVSLDSAAPETHDKFRGSAGAFDKAMAGIKLALNEGMHVTIGTVVTHDTLHSEGIAELARIAESMKLIMYFILPVPAGRWTENSGMFLSGDDISYIDGLTKRSNYLRTDFQANLSGYGCGAVKEILYLTPYGDVLPCPFLHIAVGNIFDEPLGAIRNRGLDNRWFAGYHDKCLASTDKEFIDKCLSKTFSAKELPLKWEDVFKPGGEE